jgi:signal transduction histidine kinase
MSRRIDDPARLEAVRRSVLLDSPTEESFDRLTRMAALLINVPSALVTVIDADRQFYKSCIGVKEPWATTRETPLEMSYCTHVVETGDPLIISDAREHPVTKDHPALREMNVIAYAGIPLFLDGQPLGSFCVVDEKPRQWTERDVAVLKDLASSAMSEIALRVATEAATEAVRDRDDVLAVVSHDLRNPAGVVVAMSKMLLEKELSDERRKTMLQSIHRSGLAMQRLIDDLLDLSRMEAGHLELDLRDADAGAFVRELAESHAPRADEAGIDLRVDTPDAPLPMRADPDRLLQALGNLVGNALKFTPRGGSITLGAARTPEGIVLSVQDTGPGIDAPHLPHLFDRFYQVRKSDRAGAGLGLAITRAIAQAHGGDVRVTSAVGKGARFELVVGSR